MINTHVIVGFPGENEDDFNQTKDLIKKGMFDDDSEEDFKPISKP